MRTLLLSRFRLIAAFTLLLGVSACQDVLNGPGGGGGMRPPYLAVLVFVDAPPEVTSRGPFTFRVREASGMIPVDTTFRASPADTVILPVDAATYRVEIADVPETCGVRDGTGARIVVVPPNTNTSLVRFFLNCTPALAVAAYTDGAQADSEYVVNITSAQAESRSFVIGANDTVRVTGLPAGTYDVTLRHIGANCVVTSDGGENVAVTIAASGGAFVPFRVVCAEPARRPKIVQFAATYANGSIGYYIRATDPDEDIERTFIDVTDCNRRSVLPGGGRRRGGFGGYPNVTRQDTAVIVGAYDLDMTDAALNGRCLAAWVADERGNTSEFVEIPAVKRTAARSPVATAFNARLNGTIGVQVALSSSDPDSDYLGLFAVYMLRDAVVSLPADGQPDRLVAQPPGIVGNTVPELPLGIGFGTWSDYLGVVVFLVDRAGNFTRLADADLFR